MPAPPNPYLLFGYTPEPPKKQAIIKVSCGIGDNDGFPALDSESDAYATKDDSKWGFLITGGSEFHMPLTVFQVTPDGLADKAGIRLGDIILEINEEDASELSLAQAHEKIDGPNKKIQFLVRSMDDDENYEQGGEDKSIVLRVPKPMPPPKAASIEARLVEMQRKLSEISEIPRILRSTLATVSRTFDKLLPGELVQHQKHSAKPDGTGAGRKYSYDEDALDYELNDVEDDVEEGFEANQKKSDSDVNVEFRFKLPKRKDDTPESDYSSEVDDDNVGVGDHTDDEEEAEDAYLRNYDDQSDDADEDDEDFLSTTYTWNLRNIPKLQLNDNEEPNDSEHSSDDDVGATLNCNETKKPQLTATTPKVISHSPEPLSTEKHDRMEKFERSWPWADREKIIYKQSTCHLVRRKPLGIVEKRIQSLAKQHVLDKHLRMAGNMKQ